MDRLYAGKKKNPFQKFPVPLLTYIHIYSTYMYTYSHIFTLLDYLPYKKNIF